MTWRLSVRIGRWRSAEAPGVASAKSDSRSAPSADDAVTGASQAVRSESAAAVTASKSPWLFTPAFDFFIVLGGLSLAYFLLSLILPDTPAAHQRASGFFFYMLFLCNFPHYSATLYQVYRSGGEVRTYSSGAIAATALLAGLTALAAMDPYHWIPLLGGIYILWSPWHYSAQNYGIGVMYLKRQGFGLEALDKRLLMAMLYGPFVYQLIVRNIRGYAEKLPYDIPIVTLNLPAGAVAIARGCLIAAAAAALWYLVRFVQRYRRLPTMPIMMLVLTQWLWWVVRLPVQGEYFPGLTTAGSFYRLGVPFFHCAQYLGITAYCRRRELSVQGGAVGSGMTRYGLVVLIVGLIWCQGIAWSLYRVAGLAFPLSYVLLMSVINLHHFILDGQIWRLRKPDVQRRLL